MHGCVWIYMHACADQSAYLGPPSSHSTCGQVLLGVEVDRAKFTTGSLLQDVINAKDYMLPNGFPSQKLP